MFYMLLLHSYVELFVVLTFYPFSVYQDFQPWHIYNFLFCSALCSFQIELNVNLMILY